MSNKTVIMSVLKQMNEHPSKMAKSLRTFQQSARVFSDNYPRLIDKYPDQWVAVADSAVVASGDSLKQVLTQIDDQDIPRTDVIVRFIERTQRTLIL